MFAPTDEIRSALKCALIHAQPFSMCHCDTSETQKPWNVKDFVVRFCSEKLSHYFTVLREFKGKVWGVCSRCGELLDDSVNESMPGKARKELVIIPIHTENGWPR